jgi:hypothetical protein
VAAVPFAAGAGAAAVVDHLDLDPAGGVADRDPGGGRPGVPDHVGQRLLDDPVGRQVEPGRQLGRRPLDPDLDPHPGPGHLGGQGLDLGQAGRRGQAADGPILLAEHAQQPPHLDQGLAAGRLHRDQRLARLLGLAVEHVDPDPGLHGDAHAVGDHVMELAGDPQPLLGDRPAGQLLAGLLQLGRPLLGGDGRLLAPPGPVAEPPGRGQDQAVDHQAPAVADRPGPGQPDQEEQGLGGAQAGQRDAPRAAGRHGVDVDQQRDGEHDQVRPQRGERRPGGQPDGQHGQGPAPPHRDGQGVAEHQQVGGQGPRRPGVEREHRGQQGHAGGGRRHRQQPVEGPGPGGAQPLPASVRDNHRRTVPLQAPGRVTLAADPRPPPGDVPAGPAQPAAGDLGPAGSRSSTRPGSGTSGGPSSGCAKMPP